MGLVIALIVIASVVALVITVASIALPIWGISKLVGAVVHRLSPAKEPKRIEGPRAPDTTNATKPTPPKDSSRSSGRHSERSVEEEQPKPRVYAYQDVDEGATSTTIARAVRPYLGDSVVGSYAHHVIDTLQGMDNRRQSLFAQIDDTFQRGSLSWDRYSTTASAALDTLLRNCALLANRIQSFDVTEYARMEEFFASGGSQRINTQSSTRLQRWRLLQETKSEMDSIQNANDGLLLELDKLLSELGKLSTPEWEDSSTNIAEEVRKLADETKYYR